MNCDGVRGLLSAYLDGELSSGDLLRVEQHLRHCHWCADEVDSLRQTAALVSSLEEVELPPLFHAQLHDRLVALGPSIAGVRRISPMSSRQKTALRWAVPAAAAAAVLTIGVLSYQTGNVQIPGPVAQSNLTDTNPASSGQNVAIANPGPDASPAAASGGQSTTPPVTDKSGTNTTSSNPPAGEPSNNFGTTDSSSGGPHTASAGGDKAAVAVNPTPVMIYSVTMEAPAGEKLDALKAEYPGAVEQNGAVMIVVPTDKFADTLKAVSAALGVAAPAPSSQDVAPQIAAAEQKLQESQTRLENFQKQFDALTPAAQKDAQSTLDGYKAQVQTDKENLDMVNLSATKSTITVQLQPASR